MPADLQRPDASLPPETPASTAEIDIGSDEKLAHWSKTLGVPPQALQAAVKAVGRRVDRVKDHLTGGGAGGQSDG